MTIRLGQLVTGIVCLVLLGAGWLFLAPTQLGGSASYVQTYGTSMEPRFHAGDLVVVRGGGNYRVGEIAAYRNGSLGGHVVLHRIVRIAGGHYFFKGDNNNFVDSYHPVRSELVGRIWLHVPALGRYLVWLHGSHLYLVGGVAVLLVLLFSFGFGGSRLRTRRATRAERGLSFGVLPIGAAVVLLAFAGLGAVAYTHPLSTHATRPGLYTQTGRFAYDATVPGGERVYGSTVVTTGQPLFLRLVNSANLHFSYSFGSSAAHGVAGTIALDAKVVGSDGWTRSLHLAAPQRFSGDQASVTGVLSLHSLSSLLERVDALSNVNGGTYTLTLLPKVQVSGLVGGDTLHDGFAPRLAFMLDPNQLQLQPGSASGPGAAGALVQTASGSGTVVTAAKLSVLKLELPVRAARKISLYGGGFALVVLLVGIALGLRGGREDAHARVASLYADLIIPVEGVPSEPAGTVVRTSSLEGLARIAEQAGRMIMHVERGGLDTYFVEDAGVRYVYEHGTAAAATAELAALRLAREA